ncbi:hypothetical protein HY768_07350 [candidate division TA06 bacterium]|uniref:Uncharacterized protein n=1 Tax=candidate division TA06 bacterium TaxID=2250710 RepID=A0A933MJV0_UNCT6|nr:hypothetical protein [candidate division TA06 bacterium]
MKKRIFIGLALGLAAGIIDLIPMLLQKLSWDANLSALSLWLVSGMLTASVDWKINPALKGMLVSFLVLLPSGILIGAKEPFSLVPIGVMTLILGGMLGYFTERLGKVAQIVNDMMEKKRDSVRFWIQLPPGSGGQKQMTLIEFFALHDENDKYLGCLEGTRNVEDIRQLQGEQRLLG